MPSERQFQLDLEEVRKRYRKNKIRPHIAAMQVVGKRIFANPTKREEYISRLCLEVAKQPRKNNVTRKPPSDWENRDKARYAWMEK
jgi:hypothetical protein